MARFLALIRQSGNVEMSGREVAGAVKDTEDANAVVRRLIKEYVISHGETAHPWPQIIAYCSQAGKLR